MEKNKKTKTYSIRLEVSDNLLNVWQDFRHAVKTFEQNMGILLYFDYWYDGNKIKSLKLDIEHNYNVCPNKSVIFDIRHNTNNISDIKNCKYYFLYNDSDSFISNIFELFSFIKARINYEEQKNDNRHDRKREFYKKSRNKKIIVDDER